MNSKTGSGSGTGSGTGSGSITGSGTGSGSVTGSASGTGSASVTGSASRTGSGKFVSRQCEKSETRKEGGGSLYKGSEVSTQQTTDSAYGSLGNSTTTSHYNRSHSSKSPGSNLSKSSASGSSGFDCFNQTANVEVPNNKQTSLTKINGSIALPTTSGAACSTSVTTISGQSSLCFKKTHKKTKKCRSVKGIAGKGETSVGGNVGGPSGGEVNKSGNQENGNQPTHTSTQEDKAAKVAALSQALNYIDKFRRNQENKDANAQGPDQSEINDLATTLQEASQGSNKNKAFLFVGSLDAKEHITEVLDKEQANRAGDGFCAAVSLKDGMVMCTTSSITTVLGYPSDMWNSRSFIDFVHPKDRLTFTNKITSGVTLPFGDQFKGKSGQGEEFHLPGIGRRPNTFFCRLRLYNGLKQGKFSVKDRKTTYNPFKLVVCFKDIDTIGKSEEDVTKSPRSQTSESGQNGPHSVYVIITAIPLQSAYNVKDQKGPFEETFVTRHLANCTYSMVDEAAIPYIGYLPQDLEGGDIFACYHPKDLPYLKEVYESIMAEQGKPFRSQPYRFKARNGSYVLLETDWSCFINPWSKKLEFVIGKHTLLQGPSQPNVFNYKLEEEDIPEDILNQAAKIQNEIKLILSESVSRTQSSGSCVTGHPTSKRRKELASFMGSILEEMAKVEANKVGISSENTSVIGNISLHNDGMSTESPPSYNQLNYNENLTRFFNSQPRTLSEKEALDTGFKEMDESKPCSSGGIGDSSHTASNSECGNGSCQQLRKKHQRQLGQNRIGEMTSKVVDYKDNIECDSGENATGTSGGVSANDAHHHKRLRNIHGGSGDGSGSGGGSGNGSGSGGRSGNGSGTNPSKTRFSNSKDESYRPTVLTEELLLVHNRGMEKRMLDCYKEGKKGEFRFLKNKFTRNYRQSNAQGQKRLTSGHHQYQHQIPDLWRDKNMQRTSKQCRLAGDGGVAGRQSNAIALWPPFSVATTDVTTKPHHTLADQPGPNNSIRVQHPILQPVHSQMVTPMLVAGQKQPYTPDGQHNVYRNLIPAYYFPAHVTNSTSTQPSQGGFLVQAEPSGQTACLQQPMAYLATGIPRIEGHPIYFQPIGSNVAANVMDNRETLISSQSHRMAQPTMSNQNHGSRMMSGDVQNCMSAGPSRNIESEPSKHKITRSNQPTTKFQHPSSRTAFSPNSRATSVKAEPGSALESNIESIASASVKEKKMSPLFRGNIQLSTNRSSSDSSDSSMFSLLKSSDEFMPSDNSNSSNSGESSTRTPRPVLQDPFWLRNVEVTPHLMNEYQVKTIRYSEVIKSDRSKLKGMYQTSMVKDQLQNLYRHYDKIGKLPRELLDDDSSSSNISSPTSSESSDSTGKLQSKIKKKDNIEKYAMFYEADAPLPNSDSKNQKRVKDEPISGSVSTKGAEHSADEEGSQKTNCSSSKTGTTNYSTTTTTTAASLATNPSEVSSLLTNQSQSRTSTSLGSSSAITIQSKKSSGDEEQKTLTISNDEGIGSKESASLENDNTTDSKSTDSGHQEAAPGEDSKKGASDTNSQSSSPK